MHNPFHRKIFIANALFILLGGAFLGWYYFLDGKVWDKPVEWTQGVDPMNLELVQDDYHVGETPVFLTAFCKNRPSKVTLEWTLIDGQKVSYAVKDGGTLPVGCYPSEGKLALEVEKIPLFIEDTCHAYFIGTLTMEIAGGRKVTQTLKTEPFCVKPAEVLEKVEEIINEEIKQ